MPSRDNKIYLLNRNLWWYCYFALYGRSISSKRMLISQLPSYKVEIFSGINIVPWWLSQLSHWLRKLAMILNCGHLLTVFIWLIHRYALIVMYSFLDALMALWSVLQIACFSTFFISNNSVGLICPFTRSECLVGIVRWYW